MANIDKAFDIEQLSLKESVLVATGTDDPTTGAGYEAPVGSLYLRSDGTLYTKTGVLDTNWSQVASGGFTPVNRIQVLYVGKHGSDSNNGLTPDTAFLTFAAAIVTANAQTPSSINRFEIVCEDGGIYNENITVPSWVKVSAPGATVNGSVTLNDNCEFTIDEVSNSIGNTIQRLSGTGTSKVIANTLIATGAGNTTYNSSGVLIVEAEQLYVENGSALLDESSAGHIHVDVEDIYITGAGSAVDKQSNTGFIVGYIAHILEQGSGVGLGTAIDVGNGRVDLIAGRIVTSTAYRVSGTGTLQLVCTNITGVRVQLSGSAVVDVLEARTHRWQNVSTPTFYPNRFEFLNVDTSSNPITIYLPTPPSDGDAVQVQDAAYNFGTNNLTIDGNGSTIGGSSTFVLNVSGSSLTLIYSAVQGEWTYARTDTTAFSPSNVIYVTKNGNDVSGDGSFSNPYLTVKRGVTEANAIATFIAPTTVSILDGIYDEDNPIVSSNPYVNIQGYGALGTVIQPNVNGQPLFDLTSGIYGIGQSMSSMTLRGKTNGGTSYRDVLGGSLIRFNNDGLFNLKDVDTTGGYRGLDFGNGTISEAQDVNWISGKTYLNGSGIYGSGSGRVIGMSLFTRYNDYQVYTTGTSRVELANFRLCGPDPSISGVGVHAEDNSFVLLNGGLLHHLDKAIEADDTSHVHGVSVEIRDNNLDFEQLAATAEITLQGTLSKEKQIILDGTNISLTYKEYDDDDYIVGNRELTGTPGKEFRVRDYDGRIAIGDYATNANIATGGVGGSRTLNLIDTNGNVRVWRFVSTPGEDPAVELIKGINPANPDSFGDAPISAIQTATNTISVNVSSVDYGDPLTEAGIDRTTLAERAFPPGRQFRVNGTAANDGDHTVVSATYVPGTQTIDIVVATDITTGQGAGGTVVFGGGAGRTDGVSTFVGDPGAAVTAGAGNVWWDMFLQEDDYFVIRRRTGGGGGVDNEKVRIYPDHSEWLGSTTYNDADNATILYLQTVAGAVNHLQVNNSVTGTGPSIQAVGTDTNINVVLTPKGTGTVRVPVTYTPTANNDLVTKQYVDSTGPNQTEIDNIETAVGLNTDGTFNAAAFTGAVHITSPSSTSNAIMQLDAIITESILSHHNGAVTQTFNTTPTTLLFGTSIRNDVDYTYNAGVVTINTAGTYLINFEVGYASTTAGVTACHTSLYHNGSPISGGIAHSYHSSSTSGRQTTTCTLPVTCAIGDTIQVVGVRVAGTGSLTTQVNGCRLNIRKLR